MNKMHLTVIQSDGCSQAEAIVNASRQTIVWGQNFDSFRIVDLRWWDEASYIAYHRDDYENACPSDEHDSYSNDWK